MAAVATATSSGRESAVSMARASAVVVTKAYGVSFFQFAAAVPVAM